MSGYSCTRTDWVWLTTDQPDGSKLFRGVRFSDGHEILFVDCNQRQVDAYLKAGGLNRGKNGRLSVAKGSN